MPSKLWRFEWRERGTVTFVVKLNVTLCHMSDVILGVTCMMSHSVSHSVVPVIDEKKKDILKCDAMFALKKITKLFVFASFARNVQ